MSQKMMRLKASGGVLLAICAALAGCSSRTNVSATAATPSQFTHVYITTQAVWFNTNANATPDDSGWAKFALKTPVTVDLVTQSNGTLGEVANDLRLAPGTYNSILLLPVDPALPLTASATAVSATYNQEIDYTDAAGTTHPVKLILPNQEKGFIVTGAFKVPVGGSGAGLPLGTGTTSTTNNNNNNTTNNATNLFGSPTTINPTTNTTGTNSTNKTITVNFGASFNGNRDLHLFNYDGNKLVGAVLSSSGLAADLQTSGGITGTLSLTSLSSTTPITGVSGRLAVQACAEQLTADGTHHVVIACAPVQTDGTFTIYPLPSATKNPPSYDVVIHGPRLRTIIIKSVVVTTTTPTTTAASTTAGSVATTTASGAVSLGTIIPRQTVQFPVTATANASGVLPAGAAITFYQTLNASNEVPYAIDEVAIDPFSSTLLQTPENLSAGAIDSGTYASNGSTITITTTAPREGAGTYAVAATAPLYADGISTGSVPVVAPSTTQGANPADATTNTAVVVPGLTPSNGSSAATITATITQASPGTYNQGELIVSHNGAVIGTAALDNALASGASVAVTGLPSGNSYDLSTIVWNSASASTDAPFTYQSVTTPVNLSGGSATAAVTIN
jgi:hypothetical protein